VRYSERDPSPFANGLERDADSERVQGYQRHDWPSRAPPAGPHHQERCRLWPRAAAVSLDLQPDAVRRPSHGDSGPGGGLALPAERPEDREPGGPVEPSDPEADGHPHARRARFRRHLIGTDLGVSDDTRVGAQRHRRAGEDDGRRGPPVGPDVVDRNEDAPREDEPRPRFGTGPARRHQPDRSGRSNGGAGPHLLAHNDARGVLPAGDRPCTPGPQPERSEDPLRVPGAQPDEVGNANLAGEELATGRGGLGRPTHEIANETPHDEGHRERHGHRPDPRSPFLGHRERPA
jgi:hypothetical protein